MQSRRFGGSAARLSLTIALSGALTFSMVPSIAFADPQSELDQATTQLAQIGSEYQTLRQELLDITIELEQTKEQIAETEQNLSEAQDLLASNISTDYKAGGGKLLQVIFGASDFNDFISRVFYIDKVTSAQSDAIESVRTLKAQLEEQQAETQQRLAVAQEKVDEQAANQQAAQDLVDSLSDEVKQQLEAAAETNEDIASGMQSAHDAQTGVSELPITPTPSQPEDDTNQDASDNTADNTTPPADNSGNNNTPDNNGGNTNNDSSNNGGGNTSGGNNNGGSNNSGGSTTGSAKWPIAISYALAMEGQPYVWGGESLAEGGFDCSGLVYYAYQCIGLTLPRTAGTQRTYCMNNGRYTTNPSEFQYGDLVFYNGHVAFYVGNNTVFGAQTFGTPAGYGNMYWYGTPLGAGRP